MGEVKENRTLLEELKEIKEFFPIILPLMYFFGFLYKKSYYGYFGIDIVNYVGFDDLLIEGIYILLLYVAAYLIIVLLTSLIDYVFEKLKLYRYIPRYFVFIRKVWISVFLSSLFLIATAILLSLGKSYGTLLIAFQSVAIFRGVISFYSRTLKYRESVRYILIIYGVLVIFSIVVVGAGMAKSNKLKEISKTVVSFKKLDKSYTTSDSSMVLIGETHDFLFLHNPMIYETSVFKKNDLEDLRFQRIRMEELRFFEIISD